MYGEDRELIKRTLELTEENHKILHSMRRGMRWHRVFSFIRWLIILFLAGGTYYYLQPYVEQAKSIYDTLAPIATSTSSTIQSFLPSWMSFFSN